MMSAARYLIVNADDFGQSSGVNRGIIEAHEKGIVTSASLMVRWSGAPEAAAYARANSNLGLGLHLDLGEWAYRNGAWVQLYQVIPANDRAAVADEVSRQLDSFHRMTHATPTHIDSHQHVHREEPLHSILLNVANRLGVPLRSFNSEVHYCGDFYGQTAAGDSRPDFISVSRLTHILRALSAGFTELACHPGLDEDMDSMYRWERAEEVKVLCDPRVREVVAEENIELCSFAALAGRRHSHSEAE
jgi:predicted glycoside hydrolase/deacetylase ChbG (UPF0249 family)